MTSTTLSLVTFLVTLAHGEEQYYYGNEIGDAETALDHYPQYHYHGTTNKNGHSGTALDHYHYYDDTRNAWFKITFYELLLDMNALSTKGLILSS